ncbi:hypothetical protein MKO06_10220 [Gramella sp. GC03-9]|uniref:Hydrolase n=1 Tax=Christiangramia oceanisediminis TaxID=2920386 RepID=A0A9X2KXV3_9FLAO|nr:hypothetical protein [Gramella oceanisediminis]MCP9200285.1 hypothetical protein [Gramella oceanisediminis]
MKSKILMYLFIFTLLFTIFIYVNDKRILDSKEYQIQQLEKELEKVAEPNFQPTGTDESYFGFADNEDAITYFENRNIDTENLEAQIQDAIISKNKVGEDNPLVPHAGMEGDMRINRIRVLNHKWVIADFTDGTYWGEVFLSYEIGENGEISFTPEKSFLYPRS